MNGKFYRLMALLVLFSNLLLAQNQRELISIAFWNVENFFDTVNDSLVLDDERTAKGDYGWTPKRYQKKLDHLASIIEKMDQIQQKAPDIIGLCEVENIEVVQQLNKSINNSSYQIIHQDSPDRRGIDVCLLYDSNKVLIQNYHYRTLYIYDENKRRRYTRDQLLVEALINGTRIHIIVNHWPSRSGGEFRSKAFRRKAAELNLKLIDSIRIQHPYAAIVSMGDFNDNPDSDSFKHILQTSGSKYLSTWTNLYNPMEELYKKGIGSLAYRGEWHLFDQFYISDNLLFRHSIKYLKALVYKPKEMITTKGIYKSYPKRTYNGTTYLGGYSDHYPILIYMYQTFNKE